MQMVILAGGLGARLHPMTQRVPKPMVSLHGCPFLEHVIRYVAKRGLTDIILCVGYLGEQIQGYFHDGRRFGVRIRYSVESTPLGTGGAVQHAARLIAEDFLLLNGDTYLPIDLAPFVRQARADRACVGSLVVYQQPATNNLCLDRERSVTAYRKSPTAGMTHTDAGLAYYRHDVLAWFSSAPDPWAWEEHAYQRLIHGRLLRGYPTTTPFYDMGTLESLRQLETVAFER
ncbi:MAG: NTP transferase domain-containing protein [Candidatus Omnitrophica bacterium]|nr:NTP transferase domain-containing protein [Candidatus Omnitrophota bacterium]